MKYRKDKLHSQQAEFLHSKIYNDKFVEGKVYSIHESRVNLQPNAIKKRPPFKRHRDRSRIEVVGVSLWHSCEKSEVKIMWKVQP